MLTDHRRGTTGTMVVSFGRGVGSRGAENCLVSIRCEPYSILLRHIAYGSCASESKAEAEGSGRVDLVQGPYDTVGERTDEPCREGGQ